MKLRYPIYALLAGAITWFGHAALRARFTDVSLADTLYRAPSAGDTTLRVAAWAGLILIGVLLGLSGRGRGTARGESGRVSSGLRLVESLQSLERLPELDRAQLARRALKLIATSRGCRSALVLFTDPAGRPLAGAESGLKDDFPAFIDSLAAGGTLPCLNRAKSAGGVAIIRNPAADCTDCPLARVERHCTVVAARIGHPGRVMGIVTLALDADVAPGDDTPALLGRAAAVLTTRLERLETRERRDAAERALDAGGEYFTNVLAASTDAAALKDAGLVYRRVNAAFCRLAGRSEAAILGRTDLELFPRPLADALRAADLRVIEGGAATLAEETLATALGELRCRTTRTPVIDGEGRRAGLIAVLRIPETDREEAERRRHLEHLVEERSRLLEGVRAELAAKDRLASLGQAAGSIAHEIRNPLATIRNATYFLKMTTGRDLDTKSARHLAIVESELRRAEGIVAGLLDYARGRPPRPEPFDVESLIRDVVEHARPPVGVELVLDLPPGLPRVKADPRQVSEVFLNLVTNALEALDGKGRLEIRAAGIEDKVRVTVADNGPGIAPTNMSRLFEPLFTTKKGGTGLGLALSKGFVNANGGTITVRSEPARGATFTVTLPAA